MKPCATAFAFESFGELRLQSLALHREPLRCNQLRLRMLAMSINYRDLLIARGEYDRSIPLPLVPLSDGVGEVIEVGESVSDFAVGDRVCPSFAPHWLSGKPSRAELRLAYGANLAGMLAEERVVSASGCVSIPRFLSNAQAASLPCAGVTAWSALTSFEPVVAGQRVLVQGTGGVSLFALQFAKAMGAEVAVLSSEDSKLDRAVALGADYAVNYRTTPRWSRAIRDWSGQGVDHIIEVGGADTLEESLSCIRVGGSISVIGNLSGSIAPVSLTRMLMNQVRLQGVYVGSRASFAAMLRAIESTRMTPVLDRKFSFDRSQEAFDYFASRSHFGKVVIEV